MAKRQRDCMVCGAVFDTLADHANHVMQAHDLGRGRPDRPRPMPVDCWLCTAPIRVDETTKCPCGFDLATYRHDLRRAEA